MIKLFPLTVRPSLFFPPREYRLPSLGSGRNAGLEEREEAEKEKMKQKRQKAVSQDQRAVQVQLFPLHTHALHSQSLHVRTYRHTMCRDMHTQSVTNSSKILTLPHV